MKYKNAQDLLPDDLLRQIQHYVQGSYLYIPIHRENKREWGASTDTKQWLSERNQAIWQAYREGASVKMLAQKHYLTEHSIRRIIRGHK
ncbi:MULTISPECIES: CD3324 family protein [Brevibacillus]|uniref:CD3324 family protein n=1 Tax=Brevibacillus TaxID=55080 RepID=UPI00115A6ADE|nr:CD3324 family protein [Lysinibacillus sp. SDF0063]TQR38872.1 hypothetical protein C7Y45_02095 [Lysinibacillus sp. SDF0063]